MDLQAKKDLTAKLDLEEREGHLDLLVQPEKEVNLDLEDLLVFKGHLVPWEDPVQWAKEETWVSKVHQALLAL